MTILNTAVPTIAAALHVAPLSMKAVLACYTLALALFIPISGWMADRFGTRRVFATAIGIFTLGSFLCGICNDIHLLVACRILQGLGGAMMVPVGRLAMVRSFSKPNLVDAWSFVTIPGLIGPMIGPLVGGAIVNYFHWSVIFFINIPIGLLGLYLVNRYLPDYREENPGPPDVLGWALFGSGISVLSYVLEVFGEHTMTGDQMAVLMAVSALLLILYWLRATKTKFPLLNLNLFRLRSFRHAVMGGFITRIGIGGIPFLLPLLYQVGLGFTPIQSGLLIVPQALGGISARFKASEILNRFGFRGILIFNTVIVGVLILLFSAIGKGAPVWVIVLMAFGYGIFSSTQFMSMNTLVYADVKEHETSGASSIAGTMQQLSLSFGVAAASLVTALFVPDGAHSNAPQMIHGLHEAFWVLGTLTILSALMFIRLKNKDGSSISMHKEEGQRAA